MFGIEVAAVVWSSYMEIPFHGTLLNEGQQLSKSTATRSVEQRGEKCPEQTVPESALMAMLCFMGRDGNPSLHSVLERRRNRSVCV